MAKYLYISLLVLSALACGQMVTLPLSQIGVAPQFPTTDTAVEMVVSGDWNIRIEPGERNPLVDGKAVLSDGDIVTCIEFVAVGDGLWCRHERGWTNARGMTAKDKK